VIVLNLVCATGHRFEGWFASAETFENQLKSGLVGCPQCGDPDVKRLPSGPHVASKNAMADSEQATEFLLKAIRALGDKSEDVGDRFPSEARRIHYRETPARNIRGVASADETAELLDEGIPILPLPYPPKDETH
jgi:hypothetical protein